MYQLIGTQIVKRLADGAYIPFADGNRDYEEYKQWIKDGNIPEPEFTENELSVQELNKQIQEAKEFLNYTDKKVLPDYEFRPDDNTVEWYIAERSKKRQFIRDNEGVK